MRGGGTAVCEVRLAGLANISGGTAKSIGEHVAINVGPQPHAWMIHARCRNGADAAFFPSDGAGVETAQRVCAQCSVSVECLEYALANRIDYGVWGGVSERERVRILRRRREGPLHARPNESRPV